MALVSVTAGASWNPAKSCGAKHFLPPALCVSRVDPTGFQLVPE